MIKLIQGNCLDKMKRIPDESVDMILCDLPYGKKLGYMRRRKRKYMRDQTWNVQIQFDLLWKQYKRIIKLKGATVLFASQPFASRLIVSNEKMFRCELIWEKEQGTNQFNAKYHPLKQHETILVFSKHVVKYYPQHFDKYPTTIIRVNRELRNRYHPAQKPLALVEHLLKLYTKCNNVVLDSCMGSGTTGVACVLLNRNFIGIELSKRHFERAKKRIRKAQRSIK